jgi:hypothetical protein
MSTDKLIGNNIYKLLNNLYFTVKNPESFSGILKFYKTINKKYPDISFNEVKKWILSQNVYAIHRSPKLQFPRNPIVSRFIDHNWQADLIDIPFPLKNKNYRYILMVIDNLSKYGWAIPLKDKKALSVKKGFMKILNESKRKPQILATDAGKEFTNREFRKYLKWKKIKPLLLRDSTKATVVERWNQTIKNKIYKYISLLKHKKFVNHKSFIDKLDDIIYSYNNSIHSRTKFKPVDVNKNNEYIVYQNLYRIKTPREKRNLRIGDKVRVKLIRDVFAKGYLPNYSKEIYYIHKVLYTSPYYKYKIKDKRGAIIRGSYYSKELLKV